MDFITPQDRINIDNYVKKVFPETEIDRVKYARLMELLKYSLLIAYNQALGDSANEVRGQQQDDNWEFEAIVNRILSLKKQ